MSSQLSQETLDAAADIAAEELALAAGEVGTVEEREQIGSHLENLQGEAPVEEPPPAEAPDEEGPEPEPEPETDLPEEAPSSWLEPDFEATEEELGRPDDGDPEDEYQYEDDPRLREERARRIAAEKKLAYAETQRVKAARKSWVDEAKEHAPLAAALLGDDLEKIDASSKRSFLRQAGEAHNAMLNGLKTVHGEAASSIAAERKSARQEAKDAAERAFGKPTTPDVVPADAADLQAKIAEGRQAKGLKGAIRAMIDGGMNP